MRSQQLFGRPIPIVQAPMAGTATPALAAAVSNAGALGSLGLASSSVDTARAMIAETRALTDQPFNLNLFCHKPPVPDREDARAWIDWMGPLIDDGGIEPPEDLSAVYQSFVENPEMFEMVLDSRPAVVSFHFGLPVPEWLDAFRAAGSFLMATATSVEAAVELERAGMDAIVAQGYQAGGHRGIFDPDGPDEQLETAELVRRIVAVTDLPVIAAGGIMDGSQIRAMLDIGASAVQMGTAFLLCPETDTPEHHRQLLRDAAVDSTVMTRAVSGRPARGFSGPLADRGAMDGAPKAPGFPIAYDLARQLNAAATDKGRAAYGGYWAGTGAPQSREMPAGELVATLNAELNS